MFLPSSESSPSPVVKATNASAGLFFHASANSLDDIPATLAKPSKSSLPSPTALLIMLETRVNAEPPASARIPVELIAAANAIVSASVKPIVLATPDILCPILTISLSEVAKLFPKSTTVLPNLSTWLRGIFITLANLANASAASAAVMLVVTPKSAVTLVNFSISSIGTPSRPATSANPAISERDIGISFDILRIAFERLSKSASEPSNTFLTLVNSCSY